MRLPRFSVKTSIYGSSGTRFNSQIKLIGKSPPDTVHVTDTVSSLFMGSSPNENGAIFGGTILIIGSVQKVGEEKLIYIHICIEIERKKGKKR